MKSTLLLSFAAICLGVSIILIALTNRSQTHRIDTLELSHWAITIRANASDNPVFEYDGETTATLATLSPDWDIERRIDNLERVQSFLQATISVQLDTAEEIVRRIIALEEVEPI